MFIELNLNLDMKCHSKSTDNSRMLCSDGSYGKKWNGCTKNDQVRVQCPKEHIPCNKLRTNGKEFICSVDCS